MAGLEHRALGRYPHGILPAGGRRTNNNNYVQAPHVWGVNHPGCQAWPAADGYYGIMGWVRYSTSARSTARELVQSAAT